MANEISLSIQVKYANPSGTTTGLQDSISQSRSLTQNVAGVQASTVTVPTTAGGTIYSFGNLATNGYMYLQNLDSTNYVEWGTDSSGTFEPIGKLKAGEIALFRLDPGKTFKMLANTASVQIFYWVLND